MPSSKNLTLLRHIVSNLDIEPHVAGTITQDSLNASPFAKPKIGPVGTIGIRKEAGEALSDLAGEFFGTSPPYQRGTTFKDIFDEPSDTIIFNFRRRRSAQSAALEVMLN